MLSRFQDNYHIYETSLSGPRELPGSTRKPRKRPPITLTNIKITVDYQKQKHEHILKNSRQHHLTYFLQLDGTNYLAFPWQYSELPGIHENTNMFVCIR